MISQIKCIKIGVLGLFLFILNITVSYSSLNVTKLEKNAQQINHFRNWQFKCKNGQDIAKQFVCDGLKDCQDGSDETYDQCRIKSLKKCDARHFQCQYGACIEKKYQCDGLKQCIDGSDESPDVCNVLSEKHTKHRIRRDTDRPKLCAVPASSAEKNVNLHCNENSLKTCGSSKEYVPEFSIVRVTCAPGYYGSENLESSSLHICNNQAWSWSPKITECVKKCEKLNPKNVVLQCNRNGISIAKCNENSTLLAGTKVRPTCKSTYKYNTPPDYFEITCNDDGKWDNHLLPCVPECGKPYTGGEFLIAGGIPERIGESPWHVAIFNAKKEYICGGTIITENLIISAAHCISDTNHCTGTDCDCEGTKCVNNFEVIVGKHTRNYEVKDAHQRTMKIKEIRFSDKGFFSLATNYAADIVILILQDAIPIGATIMPACLNWVDLKNHKYPSEDEPGKVAGWGITENGALSTILRSATLPFISRRRCVGLVNEDFKTFVTFDKFCAGTRNHSGTAPLQGDSGGGILFEEKGSFYLQGVVSVKQIHSNSLVLCTDLSEHIDWISSVRSEVEKKSGKMQSKIEDGIDNFMVGPVTSSLGEVIQSVNNLNRRLDDFEKKTMHQSGDYSNNITQWVNIINRRIDSLEAKKINQNDEYSNNVTQFLNNFYTAIEEFIPNLIAKSILNDTPTILADWNSVQMRVDVSKHVIGKLRDKLSLVDIMDKARKTFRNLNAQIPFEIAMFHDLKDRNEVYSQNSITLARHMKMTVDSPDYQLVSSAVKSKHEEIINKLPHSVKNLVFSPVVCIKNIRYNEYLHAGTNSDEVYADGKLRYVHTWTPANRDKPESKWQISFWNSHQIHIRNIHFNQYLHARNQTYDQITFIDFCRYVSSKASSTPDENLAWDLRITEDGVFLINVAYNEYLFSALIIKKDSQGRFVFTFKRGGPTPDDSVWQIEDCSQVGS